MPKILKSYPGVYQLSCGCGREYIGETTNCVLTRSIEHQEDSMTGKWEASSATKHSKDSKDFKDCAIIGCPQKRLQNYPAYMNVK